MRRAVRPPIRSPRFLRRLAGAREGATAVEFALVGLPFFMLTFAILEIGLIFVLSAVLDTAVVGTGRLVRTGQAETQSMTAEQFRTQFCSRMSVFSGDCGDRVFIDVREVQQFRTPLAPDPMQSGAFNENVLTYQTGQPGSLMLVRIWYRQPVVTPFLQQALARLDDKSAWLISTTSFRNEPYR